MHPLLSSLPFAGKIVDLAAVRGELIAERAATKCGEGGQRDGDFADVGRVGDV